jgi:hypothetical protein
MKKILCACTVMMLMVAPASAWAEFKDGMWEMTTQAQMKGMPQPMPPAKFRQCITKNDPVPKQQDKNYDCKTTSRKISGNTVSYTAECNSPEGKMTVSGTSAYTGNSMQGQATMNFKMQGQPAMQMTSKMTGKYLGPCK